MGQKFWQPVRLGQQVFQRASSLLRPIYPIKDTKSIFFVLLVPDAFDRWRINLAFCTVPALTASKIVSFVDFGVCKDFKIAAITVPAGPFFLELFDDIPAFLGLIFFVVLLDHVFDMSVPIQVNSRQLLPERTDLLFKTFIFVKRYLQAGIFFVTAISFAQAFLLPSIKILHDIGMESNYCSSAQSYP